MNLKSLKAFLQTPWARFIGFGLALAGLVVVLFATRQIKPKVEANTDVIPATVAPLAFAKVSADAEVRLTLPEAIKYFPALHTKLYNEGHAALNAFATQAVADHADASKDGFPFTPYTYTITWNIAAESPNLLSIYAFEANFSGGAHPNHGYQALLWDKSKNDLVPTSALFIQGADMKPVDGFVCQQIAAARSKRLGEPLTQAGSGFDCPKLLDSKLILVPSQVAGKVAALDVLYGPYEVGSYAEGDYQVRVPISVLAGVLAPHYAAEFVGRPSLAEGTIIDNPTPQPSAISQN
jgi:hypothetical protein